MKGAIKIVTIGGGSSYTPELMEGFIKRYEDLPIKEIWRGDQKGVEQRSRQSENGRRATQQERKRTAFERQD